MTGPSKAPALFSSKKPVRNHIDMVSSIVETGQKLWGMGKNYYDQHFTWTITISEDDSLFGEVLDWITAVIPEDKHKNLKITSKYIGGGEPYSDLSGDSRKAAPLTIRFDESVEKRIIIGNHKVLVSVVKPDKSDPTKREYYEEAYIRFTMGSYGAQQAVLKLLEDINANRGTGRKAVLRMVTQWNQWKTRSDLPPRTMDSIALPTEQKQRIIDDFAKFLNSEEQYNRLAIPWHRGYMFYGPPGTGKTSLVKALANEFNLDLWYISLSDLKSDASLISLMSEVGPKSILLLEDIDTVKITHDRDAVEQGSISMSSLLNTLDGVATPHGLMAVMTTNRFDILDEALTRAGRMDLVEELGWPTPKTVGQMFKHFYGKKLSFADKLHSDQPLVGVSMAQISEIMKRHMDDHVEAGRALDKLLTKPIS